MPGIGGKTDRDEKGRFVAGNKSNGGRPAKPDWLKGRGLEALMFARDVMMNEEEPTSTRLAAAKMIVEYDLGKPRQAVEAVVTQKDSGGLSLAEKLAFIQQLQSTGGDTNLPQK